MDAVNGGVLDRFRLDGKVAVVTGASSGLGAASAVALAEAGADVVLAARRADILAKVAAEVEATGRKALPVPTDVTDPAACTSLVQAALDAFGHIDVLLNSAGIAYAAPASRDSVEDFRGLIDVNVSAVYWMSQACGRVMARGGSIINLSSIIGLASLGIPQTAYAASKTAIVGITRDLAQQWTGRKGIRVNAVAPGYFDTEMMETYSPDRTRLFEMVPAGRLGEPMECAAAVVFLASDAASFVSGAVLSVDGGLSTWTPN